MPGFDIDSFVQQCLDALGDGQLAVRDVVARTVASPPAIESALGTPDTNPVMTTWHHSDSLTVLHIVWPPEVDLYAHDHNMWAVIGLYGGREDNHFFRRLPHRRIVPSGGKELYTKDVLLLGGEAVHSVSNPSRDWTGAIHVYGGDFFNTPRTMWERGSFEPLPYEHSRTLQVLEAARSKALGES